MFIFDVYFSVISRLAFQRMFPNVIENVIFVIFVGPTIAEHCLNSVFLKLRPECFLVKHFLTDRLIFSQYLSFIICIFEIIVNAM